VDEVIEAMSGQYTELLERQDQVRTIVKAEEERFLETLSLGLNLFESVSNELSSRGEKVIPGEKAFVLYDTYGFPKDLTKVMAEEKGMEVDEAGFQKCLDEQREKSRVDGAEHSVVESAAIPTSKFVGYQETSIRTRIKYLGVDENEVGEAAAGSKVLLVIDPNPFYGEAGGQLGDSGRLTAEGTTVAVSNAIRVGTDKVILRCTVEEGLIRKGDSVRADVHTARRFSMQRAHTATHLLHAVLRETIGGHVQQQGSLVAPDRLRFDFTHYDALSKDILVSIEEGVNEWIRQSFKVDWAYTGLDEARDMGALAFFEEKYGNVVRIVKVDEISLELCGGTHVSSTGEIGAFHILSEGSIALGVRRIEAVTGEAVLKQIHSLEQLVEELGDVLKVGEGEISKKVIVLLDENKNLRRELKCALKETALRDVSRITEDMLEVEGVGILTRKVAVSDMESLREVADHFRSKIESGVVVLAAESEGKAIFVATVTDDLVADRGISAGDIVKKVSGIAGGSGGGKPRMAQAGGKDVQKIEEALSAAPGIVEQLLREGK
jgi:alanyl-tRNA synthetase